MVRSAAPLDSAFSLAKVFLDGIEVWAVGRQEEEACAGRLDGVSNSWSLMARQIVHNHDVAGADFGHQHLLDIGLEGIAVDRTVEHHRCCDAGQKDSEHA